MVDHSIYGINEEIIGLKVNHQLFGQGIITGINSGNSIIVEFAYKTTKFLYPDVFQKFLKAQDPDVQAMIVKNIDDIKQDDKQRRLAEKASKKATREKREFEEKFASDYHVENLATHPILTYQQVENQFGIRIAGFGRGINPTENAVVLISSIKKSNGNFVYHDKWTKDGDYLYSGEGKIGDQKMTNGNLEIKNTKDNGKIIHLFVKFSPQEYYYQGVFRLVDHTFEDDIDENGNIRKEYKFRLRKSDHES
ncbi:MAG: hypothetical protein LIO41_04190 [Ruminococcus sp.]|nr:hypothetical protein [Ruminococcus sp.]